MGTGPVMGEQAGALKLRARRRVSCIPRGSSPPPRKARPPHLEGDVHQHQALRGAGSSPGARCEQRGEGAQLLSCLHGSTHHGGTKPRTFASSGVQVCIPNRPSVVLSERQRKERSCCLPPPTSALLESSEPLSPSSWPCSGQIRALARGARTDPSEHISRPGRKSQGLLPCLSQTNPTSIRSCRSRRWDCSHISLSPKPRQDRESHGGSAWPLPCGSPPPLGHAVNPTWWHPAPPLVVSVPLSHRPALWHRHPHHQCPHHGLSWLGEIPG